jgi:Fic family protein
MASLTNTLNGRLAGTPYQFPNDRDGIARAKHVTEKTGDMQNRCARVARLLDDAGFAQGERTTTDLRVRVVYESNAIEGVGASLTETDELVRRAHPLAHYTLQTSLSDEPKIREVLGLNAAHLVAEQLGAMGSEPIREIDLRELHRFILGAESPHAGRYKQMNNSIVGSPLRTAHFGDVGTQMQSLAEWLNSNKTSPPLAACIVHAWLTHIHPFLDGNGRMARLMANMVLSRFEWPPLVIKSSVDRGEYLDALKHSDEAGDILPLFDLFVKAIDRALVELEDPDYIGRLLARDIDSEKRPLANASYAQWVSAEKRFRAALISECRRRGVSFQVVGSLQATDFDYLARGDRLGNGWYAKIEAEDIDLLAWFGFRSNAGRSVVPEWAVPAIFFSARDESPHAAHPYKTLKDTGVMGVDEVALLPGDPPTVAVRVSEKTSVWGIDMAAAKIAEELTAFSRRERV